MSKWFTRVLGLVLSALLVFSLVPTNAHAVPRVVRKWTPTEQIIYTVPAGTGSKTEVKAFVIKLDAALKATPAGETVRVSTYATSDSRVVSALIAERKRGVNVRFTTWHTDYRNNRQLLNRLKKVLGTDTSKPSYFKVCHGSCYLGGKDRGTQHAKVITISRVLAENGRLVPYISFVSSGNLSKAAASKSWNQTSLFVGRKRLYDGLVSYLDGMRFDRTKKSFKPVRDGDVTLRFYPGGGDPVKSALAATSSCKAGKGYGVNGRTKIRVVMYVWTMSMRRTANDLVRLRKGGCDVGVVVTSRMTQPGIIKILLKGGVPVYNSRVKGRYSHGKIVAINGRVGRDATTNVVWGGSVNQSWSATNRNSEVGVEARSRYAVDRAFGFYEHVKRYSKRLK